MRTCGRCGRQFKRFEAQINGVDYCHPFDSIGRSCYSEQSFDNAFRSAGRVLEPVSGAKNRRAEKARRKRLYALHRARALLTEARKTALLEPSHANLTRVHALESTLALLEGLHGERHEAEHG